MVNPVKLMQMRNEAVAMQKKMQSRKILGESRDNRIKLQMNAAQELEMLIVDESIVDEQTLRIINNGIKEAFKDYQKKLQKEMVKDVDLDQIKKLLG
jgi:DNA-binding protein YbaB